MTAAAPIADRSPAEFMFADFADEHASTRRMLERYPDGKGDWRPHEKSRTLSQLATHVASILGTGALLLQTDDADILKRVPQEPLDSKSALALSAARQVSQAWIYLCAARRVV